MTNVSKKNLGVTEEKLIITQITNLLADKSASNIYHILDDLLGAEEKLMVAKRFAIIIMLWKGFSFYQIAQKLHVSTSTVDRINNHYQAGAYEAIITLLKKPTVSISDILKNIDNILHLGGILPHYNQTYSSKAYRKPKRKPNF